MDEPTADPIDPSFFDFDNGEPMRKEDLKVLIYNEVLAASENPLIFEYAAGGGVGGMATSAGSIGVTMTTS
jgi:mitogen-activated protein kinase 1/3